MSRVGNELTANRFCRCSLGRDQANVFTTDGGGDRDIDRGGGFACARDDDTVVPDLAAFSVSSVGAAHCLL